MYVNNNRVVFITQNIELKFFKTAFSIFITMITEKLLNRITSNFDTLFLPLKKQLIFKIKNEIFRQLLITKKDREIKFQQLFS